MKRIYPQPLLLAVSALLAITECSSKGSDASPSNSIPANSASLLVDGVPYPVDMNNTDATIESSTGVLRVQIGTSNRQGSFLYLHILEFRSQPGKIQFGTGSTSGFFISAGQLTAPDNYDTQACSPADRSFDVIAIDKNSKTVSVKFSGTICGATASKKVTEGQFNLPYKLI